MYSFGPRTSCMDARLHMSAKSDNLNFEEFYDVILFSGWWCNGRPDFAPSLMFSFRMWTSLATYSNALENELFSEFPLRLTRVILHFSRCTPYLKSELEHTFVFSVRRRLESAPASQKRAIFQHDQTVSFWRHFGVQRWNAIKRCLSDVLVLLNNVIYFLRLSHIQHWSHAGTWKHASKNKSAPWGISKVAKVTIENGHMHDIISVSRN